MRHMKTVIITILILISTVLAYENWSLQNVLNATKEALEEETSRCKALEASITQLLEDYDKIASDYQKVWNEKLALLEDYATLQQDYAYLLSNYSMLQSNYTALNENYSRLSMELENLMEDYVELTVAYARLNDTYTALLQNYTVLLSYNLSELQSKYETLLGQYQVLEANYSALKEAYSQVCFAIYSPLWANETVTPSISELSQWLEEDDTDRLPYSMWDFVCGDFSVMLSMRAKLKRWDMGIVAVLGRDAQGNEFNHAFNAIKCKEGLVYVEPQNDEIFYGPIYEGGWYNHPGFGMVYVDLFIIVVLYQW
ncbi:MAG: hypothetical protein QXK93_00685 [Candidatus Bathyarchaeia archaeon]